MIAELTKPAVSDARREPRTSLFVMATLYSGSGSIPVKVRDVSTSGALIEGGIIPSPGTSIRLCRGRLNILGEIIWRQGEKAGLRLEAGLAVADWLPGGRSRAPQQRVDELFQQVKSSASVRSLAPAHDSTFQSSGFSAAELTRIIEGLESLAEDLAADPDIVKRHMAKLQTLDITAQALRRLAEER